MNVGDIEYTVSVETQKSINAAQQFDKQMDSVQRSAKKTDAEMNKLGTSMTKLAASIGAIVSATAMLNEFKKAVNVTKEFNVVISRLSSLTGLVGPELENLSKQAREIGATSTLSASQAASAMQLIGSRAPQLLESAEALGKVTQAAVVLAEAAGVDMVTAAGIMTSTMNQFNMSAEESDRIINTLAAGARNGAADVNSIAAALARAGTQADISGVSIEEFTGLVQALAKGEITASDAGTALRNVLLILDNAADKNLRPSVVGVTAALENLEDAQKNGLDLLKTFGRENITAANILIRNRQEYERVTEAVTDTTEAYDQQRTNVNNLEGDLKNLSSAYEDLQITIGQLTDDQLRSLTQNLTQLLLYIGDSEGGVTRLEAALKIAGTAAASVAAIIAGRVVTAMGVYAASQVTALQATMAKINADKLAAGALKRRTAVEKEAARTAMLAAQADFNAAKGSGAHAIALNNLTAAKSRYMAATTAAAAAQSAANRVMTLGTVAANGLRTAMAFLGGPVGVAMLAAVAIYSFASASREAAPPTDDLTKSVEDLSAAQRELATLEAARQLDELGEKARILADNLKYAEDQMGSGSKRSQRYAEDAMRMRVEQEKLNEEISVYRKRLEDLQNYKAPDAPKGKGTGGPPEPTTTGKTPEPTTTEEGQKRLQAMRDEIELAKKIGVAKARLAAVQRMGADATTEEREEAERLATELYSLEKAQAAAKKATEEARDAAKSDKDVLAELTEQLYQTTLEADALRDRQAELQLSKYATPEQVAEVQELAKALEEADKKTADLERRRSSFGTDIAGAITGNASPLSGGMFDDQTERYEAEAQAEQQRYADAMERLREAKELELEVKGGYMALEEQMAQEHADRMAQIEKAKNDMMMTQAADAFGSMASSLQDYITTFGSENKELMAMMKASAIAQTVIQTYQGAQQAFTALSSIPFVGPALGVAAAGAAIAGGMARVASIRAQGTRRHGGPVAAGSMYRVNEGGAPEVFQNNLGQQYMIPNSRGEVISNKDAQGGGGGGVVVNIHNAPQGTNAESSEGPNGEQMIDIWIADFTSDGRTASVVQNKFGLAAQGR